PDVVVRPTPSARAARTRMRLARAGAAGPSTTTRATGSRATRPARVGLRTSRGPWRPSERRLRRVGRERLDVLDLDPIAGVQTRDHRIDLRGSRHRLVVDVRDHV